MYLFNQPPCHRYTHRYWNARVKLYYIQLYTLPKKIKLNFYNTASITTMYHLLFIISVNTSNI